MLAVDMCKIDTEFAIIMVLQVIILPIIWVFYTDYKKAEAEHKASKAAKAE
jgi:low temperature requirement protein LtrA